MPGQYVIQADRGRKQASIEGEFGTLAVSVDGTDVKGLILQTSAGSSIAGRVVFDSYRGATAPTPSQIEITPVPIDADMSPMTPANADIYPDWRFEIAGVNGPRRLQVTRTPAGWRMKAILLNGIEVTDRPIAFGRAEQSLTDVEVVLTDAMTELSAMIADDQGMPVAGAHLVMFSIDRDRWYPDSRYLRHIVAGNGGAVSISGMAPGGYYAVAVIRLPPDGDDAWQDPENLESLMPHATSFTLDDAQKQVIRLRMSR